MNYKPAHPEKSISLGMSFVKEKWQKSYAMGHYI
ncbi:hypothetical protein SAMN05428988_3278 [Chitinophaga sp. YR573]|nr:hypothetical protein SAMN05428988_3278 [Chitinophaga sp. YR573]